MDRDDLDDLDKRIFSGNDSPLDAKDDVYQLLTERVIENRVYALGGHPMSDRFEVMFVEVEVAMLYRLSLYFCNVITKSTDVMLWRLHTLAFFDRESEARDDTEAVKEWRRQIEENFDRLIHVLNGRQPQT